MHVKVGKCVHIMQFVLVSRDSHPCDLVPQLPRWQLEQIYTTKRPIQEIQLQTIRGCSEFTSE